VAEQGRHRFEGLSGPTKAARSLVASSDRWPGATPRAEARQSPSCSAAAEAGLARDVPISKPTWPLPAVVQGRRQGRGRRSPGRRTASALDPPLKAHEAALAIHHGALPDDARPEADRHARLVVSDRAFRQKKLVEGLQRCRRCRAGRSRRRRCRKPGQGAGPRWPGPAEANPAAGDRWPINPQRPEPVDQGLTEQSTWGARTPVHQQARCWRPALAGFHCFKFTAFK